MNQATPDKARILSALQARIAEDLEAATQAHQRAAEAATHEESRAEHDKDTRATEASYLARGLAKRVIELREVAGALLQASGTRNFGPDDAIALGALVAVEDPDGDVSHFLLAGRGGGMEVQVDGITVRVVTPEAPLGDALIGCVVDDTALLRTPRGDKEFVVVSVS